MHKLKDLKSKYWSTHDVKMNVSIHSRLYTNVKVTYVYIQTHVLLRLKYEIRAFIIIKCLDNKFKGSSIYYLMYSFLTYTIGC